MHFIRHSKILWTIVGILCLTLVVILGFESSLKFTDTNINPTQYGMLSGKVTIGPNCPVERVDQPCLPSPEAYVAREFLIKNANQKQVAIFHGDRSGNFSLSLPSGVYTVVSVKTGIGFMSKDLPQTVEVKSGQTTILNIDIDTGIR